MTLPRGWVPLPPPPDPLRERWEAYKRSNPHVLPALIDLARQAIVKGYGRTGVRFLLEICRWTMPLTPQDGFALDNRLHRCVRDDLLAVEDIRHLFAVRRRSP